MVTVGDFVKKIESIYPYIMPKVPKPIEDGDLSADARANGSVRIVQRLHQLHAVLCRLSAIRRQSAISSAPARWPCCSATTATRATADGSSGWTRSHGEDGVWACTAVGICSEVCPKQVDPANAVNQNKTNSALDFFLRHVRREAPP